MFSVYITPLFKGFATGGGLIIAIGAQNAFVLKQGILKNHVLVTALICALIDALLIVVGVGGFGAILTSSSILLLVAKWGGVTFLLYYGLRSFIAVFKTQSLKVNHVQSRPSLNKTISMCLVFSFLNPHVYLDTVVLLGSIGSQFNLKERPFFALGAVIASSIWFFSLCYGARVLAPLFRKPITWKVLDFIIGVIMWVIAGSLIMRL